MTQLQIPTNLSDTPPFSHHHHHHHSQQLQQQQQQQMPILSDTSTDSSNSSFPFYKPLKVVKLNQVCLLIHFYQFMTGMGYNCPNMVMTTITKKTRRMKLARMMC